MIELIAETAWHHNGDFEFQRKLISDICEQGEADIVKLHITLNRKEYLAPDYPNYSESNNLTFSKIEWEEVLEIVHKNDKKLMLLLNDQAAVQFASKFEPEFVEVHATAINDLHLLDSIKMHCKKSKVVLGIGGSRIEEIDNAIEILGNDIDTVLMFGFQNYPTKYSHINFNKMKRIMSLYSGFEFGYADHTAWDDENNLLITLLGTSVGCKYVEKHVTNHYGVERTDFHSAISIEMLNNLKKNLNLLSICNGDGSLKLNEGEKNYAITGKMKRAAFLNQNVKKGDEISPDHIEYLRTSKSTDLEHYMIYEMYGKIYNEDIEKGSILKLNHIK